MREILDVAGLRSTTPAFRAELVRVSDRLGVDPSALAAVISFETGGTFSASIRNPHSSAVGLIQFMEQTAERLGTSTDVLAAMSAIEQLAYVETYLRLAAGGRLLFSPTDLYMAVFAPSAIGRPDGWPIPYSGKAYEQNSALDRDRDGQITKGEAATQPGASRRKAAVPNASGSAISRLPA